MNPAKWLLFAVAAGSTGCSATTYTFGGGPGRIPGTSDSPGFDGRAPVPSTRSSATQATSRQICRNTSIPHGWIAVDYVSSPSCSPLGGTGELGANSALIVQYGTLPVDTILQACADQHLPQNWMREPEEPSDVASTQCPRRPGDTRTGATIVRIRRRP
jgi:hypothetical protein